MNVDKIEKMKSFPSFFKYIKINLISNLEWVLLIFIMAIYFFSLVVALVFIIVFSIFEYILDKKIFLAFLKRRERNDSN